MDNQSSAKGALRAWFARQDNRVRLFCIVRYLYPLIWALTLGVIGLGYNIRAGSAGRLSLWHLLFQTFKQGRAALLTGNLGHTARGYYILLLIGVFLAVLATLAALIFAVLALYTYFVATNPKRDAAERQGAKTLFRAVFRGRFALYLANLLLLVPAYFPLYFSFVSNRHPGGGFISLGFDPVLVVSLVFALGLAVLCNRLAKCEKGSPWDMFASDEEETVEKNEGEDDSETEETPE